MCIPYACVFTYFALKFLVVRNPFSKFEKYISMVLVLFLLILAFFTFGKWYTSLTSIFTAMFLLVMLIKKVNMAYYYLTYVLILPFFLLSNGVLTGSFLDSPIVWYNNAENMGIRIFTIPVEDSVYGFLLVAMNIALYEYFKKGFVDSIVS